MSDHDAVVAELEMSVQINRKSPRKVFLYKKANWNNIKNDLLAFKQMFLSSNPICTPISKNWSNFKSAAMDTVERNIPTKILTSRRDLPWINRDLKRAIRKKQRLYNSAKKSQERYNILVWLQTEPMEREMK